MVTPKHQIKMQQESLNLIATEILLTEEPEQSMLNAKTGNPVWHSGETPAW